MRKISGLISRCCRAKVVMVALVAQLDRASDFESEGREFESLRARQRLAMEASALQLISVYRPDISRAKPGSLSLRCMRTRLAGPPLGIMPGAPAFRRPCGCDPARINAQNTLYREFGAGADAMPKRVTPERR